MKLITFLKKSIAGELSTEAQMNFLKDNLDITPKELATVARFLQKQIKRKPRLEDAMDVCGTGGSGLPRINTSTIAALILSSRFGIGVAKHGNKASSGRFGSFDLIESLGTPFTDDIAEIEEKYKKDNLALLFAPFFHPVMKHLADVRKKIGKPTFFNLLGPLLNPASPKHQIIGTTFRDKMFLIAEACQLLGKEKVYVVCGEDGLDEVTLTSRTFVVELSEGKIKSYTVTPEDFGISKAAFSEIQGGDKELNTQIARDILAGTCVSRHRDLVLVNIALALKLAGKAKTLREGYKKALNAISSASVLQKITANKKIEVEQRKQKYPIKNVCPSVRNFTAAIEGKNLSLIAEVKKASPSEGVICKNRFNPVQIAKGYERDGASAISVLCDKKFFHGDVKYLKKIAENTLKIPILCKDFIIDEYQIYEARKNGADAVLLIASILTEEQLKRFLGIVKNLKMSAICEVHNLSELKKVLNTPAKIIGINNRDLHTFKTDTSTTLGLVKHIPKNRLIVSESGFHARQDVSKVRGKVDAILVGIALMKGKKINEFIDKKLKICGIKTIKQAKFCEQAGVDFIGLNFVSTSKRFISQEKAVSICKAAKNIAKVGIFHNHPIAEVNKIAKGLNLDYIQLSGDEPLSFVKRCCKPVIKAISVSKSNDLQKALEFAPHVAYILLDGSMPGSGKTIKVSLKNANYPFLLAGGVSPKNVKSLIAKANPIGIDVASGVEKNGKIDLQKIILILNQLKSC